MKTNSPVINKDQSDNNSQGKLYITVKKGQTLGGIAQRYKTSIYKIKKLNNMRSDFLREGQRLRVR